MLSSFVGWRLHMKGISPTFVMVVKPTCKNCPTVLSVLNFSHAKPRLFRMGIALVVRPTTNKPEVANQKNKVVLAYCATLSRAAQLKPKALRSRVKMDENCKISATPGGQGTVTVLKTPRFWNKASNIPKLAVVHMSTLA